MNENMLIVVIIVSYAISLWILYGIIRSATSTNKRLWNEKAQINLLIKIAEKLGVNPSEMDIIKKENNKS